MGLFTPGPPPSPPSKYGPPLLFPFESHTKPDLFVSGERSWSRWKSPSPPLQSSIPLYYLPRLWGVCGAWHVGSNRPQPGPSESPFFDHRLG